MKKIALLSCLLLVTLFVSAQTHQLRWLPVETWATDSAFKSVVSLEDGNYERSSTLPSYAVTLATNNKVSIENTIFIDCTPEELRIAESQLSLIPTQLSYNFRLVTERKRVSYILEIFPFIVDQGKVKKLQSFDIKQLESPLFAATQTHLSADRYTSNSVLKSGRFVKISVDKTGIYKLTYEALVAMGISPTAVRVFGYGGAMLNENFSTPYIDDLPEIATYTYTGADGQFGAGDYILFYGQGPTSWEYNTYSELFQHTQNVYSNYGYYFVTSDAGTGKQIEAEPQELGTPTEDILSFTDYLVQEKDLVNLVSSGREFYGEEFNSSKLTYNYSYALPNVLDSTATFRLSVAANSQLLSTFVTKVNNTTIGSLSVQSMANAPVYEHAKTAITSPAFYFEPVPTNQLNVSLTYSNANGQAWLNFFELNVKRLLKLTNASPLFFRNVDSLNVDTIRRFVVQGANNSTQVWNVSDPLNIKRVPATLTDDQLTFAANTSTVKEYVAIDPAGSFLTPTVIGEVANQNLHGLSQVDMLILAPSEFMSEAQRLAQAHSEHDGLSTHVVDANLIFNEFSSGTPDATAYRRFVKMFYDRANSSNLPRYLLLFGDGNFDNRKIISTDIDINKLLTYQSLNSVHGTESYVSDDYFAFLDDNEGVRLPSERMDIGVGRFPVYNQDQAKIAVDKAISYMNNAVKGSWKNQVVFLADDGDNNLHVKDCDSVAELTMRLHPELLVRKLYLDAYTQEVSASGESYPLVRELFDNYIKFGTLMINFMGHGGYNAWTNEGILTTERIENMYNEKLPLFVTATCDFSRFDTPRQSGGEKVFLNAHGGGIALYTTTRTVYAGPNYYLNREFVKNVFARDASGNRLRLGDIMRNAKNARSGDANKMNFTLLGDPALQLAYPSTHNVVTDSVKLVDLDQSTDTIRALSKVRLVGHLEDNAGVSTEDFNGYVNISVFDKKETIGTLSNDVTVDSLKKPYVFTDRTNALFVGSAKVENGRFVADFIVPKDIRYNYGLGRIVYYAADEAQNFEANGYYENVIIGGEDSHVIWENQGPDVQIYLNSPDFKSGDKVNESPLFVANVYDQCGINAIGNGVGHDIILKLDNNPLLEKSLNFYYTTEIGNYQSGTVNYQLYNLEEGKHHILFRVWDLQNNSSTAELEFIVEKGLQPKLSDMFVYPNPAINVANFVYVHDRPEQPLSVHALVYDLSGRLVFSGEQTVFTYDNRTEIAWDFTGSVRPGIYLVRMDVAVSNSEKVTKTLKLMIKEQ